MGHQIRHFAPEFDTPRRAGAIAHRETPAVRNHSVYEGGAHTRRTRGWNAPTASPNSGLLGNLSTLRDRSRAAVRNDGFAKGAIEHLTTNVIGTGIVPISKADDPELRKLIQAAWLVWTYESDADGLLDFEGQQTQAARGCFEAGEMFARLRVRKPEDGLSVPLQVQLLEPELCPITTHQLSVTGTGFKVKAGIEFNAIGRRVGYWFHPARTSDPDELGDGRLVRVAADSVIHLFDPKRAGQLRGEPLLTPALCRFHELDKFDDATLLRQQLQNMFVAFVKRPAVAADATSVDVLTGEAVQPTDDRPMVGLEPGITQELDPGEDVTFSDPPDVSSTYPDFMRQQLLAAFAAVGVPYELVTGDMRGLNDRVIRVVLQEFRRRVQVWQHQIISHMFCRRVWMAWMTQAVISKVLPIPIEQFVQNPEPFARVKWMPHGFPYINPLQDEQAADLAIRGGRTSRSAACAERGEDVEEIDQQQADDNKRADELGLKYDSDARHGKAPKAAAVDPNADPADEAGEGNGNGQPQKEAA